MVAKKLAHLNLVSRPGMEYELGEFLTEANGTKTQEPGEILSKLNLILNWQEESKATLNIEGGRTELFECRLSVDPDEKIPSELYLKFINDVDIKLFSFTKVIRVNTELFRICYQFEARVLTILENGIIVLTIPEEIVTCKTRRISRIKLSYEQMQNFPTLIWKDANNIEYECESVSEIGLGSLVAEIKQPIESKIGKLVLETFELEAFLIRNTPKGWVIQFFHRDKETFGRFFELYQKYAFPHITLRSKVDPADLYDLYVKTNYLGQFIGKDLEAQLKEDLMKTWKNVDEATHKNTADYVAIDDNSKLCGASSIVRGFQSENESLWVFHQLCCITSPALLDHSGQLYRWRAEYLYWYPEDLKVIGWFRSESRWLERIYVKFGFNSSGRSEVRAVSWHQGTYVRNALEETAVTRLDRSQSYFGNMIRSHVAQGCSFASSSPDYLNACGSLNGIFNLAFDPKTLEEFKSLADVLLDVQQKSSQTLLFTLSYDAEATPGFEKHVSDRFFVILKEDLANFLSTLDHSLAVTKRKIIR